MLQLRPRGSRPRFFLSVAFSLAFCAYSGAQQLNVDPTLERGLKPYGAFEGGAIDSISMTNGSLNLHIPMVSYPQRGGKLHFGFYLKYSNDSYIHTPSTIPACTTPPYDDCDYGDYVNGSLIQIVPDFDFTAGATGTIPPAGHAAYAIVNSPDGSRHEMIATSNGWRTIDATGYLCLSNCATVIDRDGIRHSLVTSAGAYQKTEDPDGNFITGTPTSGGSIISYTDTVGRTVALPPALGLGGAGFTTDFSGCTGSLPTIAAYLWTLPSYGGGQMTYKICYANVYYGAKQCYKSGSGIATCGIWDSTWPLIQQILLPNGTSWLFQYDSDNPSNPVGATGNLLQVTFPTGGYIKYGWSTSYFCQIPTATTSTTYSYTVASRTINSNDGTGDHTSTYSFPNVKNLTNNPPYTTTSIDPLGDKTVHTLTPQSSNCSFYETQTQTSDPSGAVVKTVATDYYSTQDPFYLGIGSYTSANTVPIRVTTTWPNGSVSKVETDYDSGVSGYLYGVPIARREYDYGTGGPGALLRETFTNYQALANSNYLANNLLTAVSSVQTCSPIGQGETGNCAGNTLVQRAYTQNTYDQALSCAAGGGNSPCSSGISTQHESSPDGVYRGDLTTSGRWLNPTGSYLNTTRAYFDTGMVNQTTDPAGHVTSYAYSSAYVGSLPTTITNALSQATTNAYDFNSGLMTSTTDPNQVTSIYSYDSLWRPLQANYPDGGQDAVTRQEVSFPFTATLTSTINSSQNKIPLSVFDGLGRVSQTQLTSDPQGIVYTDTTYDPLGRVATVSNPYRTGNDPTSSSGTTTYTYDALSRKIAEKYPDNSVVTTAYCGPNTLVTDPTGKWRRSRVNGLGQLVEVDEPNAVGVTVASTGCPARGSKSGLRHIPTTRSAILRKWFKTAPTPAPSLTTRFHGF